MCVYIQSSPNIHVALLTVPAVPARGLQGKGGAAKSLTLKRK